MRKLLLLLAVALCITGCNKDMVDRSELDNANKEIEDLKDEVASLNDTIAKRDSTIAYKDSLINDSGKEAKKANDALTSLQQRLDDKEATINNLNKQIADLRDEETTFEAESTPSLESSAKQIAPYFTIAALLVLVAGSVWTIILLHKVKKASDAPVPANGSDNDEPDNDGGQPGSTVHDQAVLSNDYIAEKDRKNKNSPKDKIKGLEAELDNYKEQLKDKKNDLKEINRQLEKLQKDSNDKDDKITKLNTQINDLKTDRANTQKDLDETNKRLIDTTESLNKKVAEVKRLEEAQETFTTQLASVPFAQPYCLNIVKLTEVVDEITREGCALLNNDLEDRYYIYKALAIFTQRLEKFNQADFTTEVKMATRSHFALKSSKLAGFDQSQTPDKLEMATKQYFFDTYLKTYINAAVVLNETLAGMHYLIKDLDTSSCKVFNDLRTKLESACRDLGIEVSSVKVFDNVGQNTTIQVVDRINFDSGNSGQILEIKNCGVRLAGGMMPQERIQVIVKE